MVKLDAIGWTANSLRHRIKELRMAAARCHKAYTKEPMKSAALYLNQSYGEAADVLDARLTALLILIQYKEKAE